MKWKRFVSAALCAGMVCTGVLSGCGSTSSGSGSSGDGSSGDTVTLTVFSQLANYSGEQTGWIADILLEKFNVVLNIIPDLNGTLSTRMEAGDLGDIVVWGNNTDDYQNAIDAGLLYDWNEDDLLEEYGTYIYENMSTALEYNASYSGGVTYGFGHNVATSSEDHASFMYNWDIRWDLYSQLGYPEVNDLDDLIDVFLQMKEICPTDENGNPTYAICLWPDWDGSMVMYVKSTVTAYYGYDELGIGLYDPLTGDYYDCLMVNDDGTYGPYLEVLQFYNKLYQNGLLDPDSMTATWDTMSEKVQAGGTFFSIFNYAGDSLYNTEEHLAEGKAMYPLKPNDATPIVYGMSTLGSNRVWTIGAKTEYPELCMEIINWLCTPEGRMVSEYGPEDVCWYYDEDGYTYFTEFGAIAYADKDGTSMESVGYSGSFHDGQLQINNTTWDLDATNTDSNGERYNYLFWASNQAEASSDIEQDWRDYTGYDTMDDYMESGSYVVSPISTYLETSQDEEFQTKYDQTTNCIVNYSWNAIYAESDEEFAQIVEEMISQANDYYYQEILEWYQNEASLRYAAEQELE